ncbi:MAG: hypothetical protein IPJ74_01745 [Saprospiraceae bacterium]|nr:hypothetical protein [Saprospiraceae bacterium]
MIFRKFRKQLLENSNLKQYFAYAIGEIFLVMVGILLALQVNNWNEYRKAKKEELNILYELSSSLQEDILSLQEDSITLFKKIQAARELVRYLQNRQPYTDSLQTLLGQVAGIPILTINTSGFTLLQDRGLDIITDTQLRQKITHHYEYDIELIKAINSKHNIRHETFVNWMDQYFYWEGRMPRLYETNAILHEPEFIGRLKSNTSLLEGLKNMLNTALLKTRSLHKAIQDDIKQIK